MSVLQGVCVCVCVCARARARVCVCAYTHMYIIYISVRTAALSTMFTISSAERMRPPCHAVRDRFAEKRQSKSNTCRAVRDRFAAISSMIAHTQVHTMCVWGGGGGEGVWGWGGGGVNWWVSGWVVGCGCVLVQKGNRQYRYWPLTKET